MCSNQASWVRDKDQSFSAELLSKLNSAELWRTPFSGCLRSLSITNLARQALLRVLDCLPSCWGCLSRVIQVIDGAVGPYLPLGCSSSVWPPAGLCATHQSPLDLQFSWISFHLTVNLSNLYFHQLLWGFYEWVFWKPCWSQGKQHLLLSLHPQSWLLHCTRLSLVKHDFPILNPWWLPQIIYLTLICLQMFSRIICAIIFLGTEEKLIGL